MMITRRLFLLLHSAVLLPHQLRAADTYDAKTLSGAIPKPSDLGADWHPLNPERLLTVSPGKVTVFYDYKPPKGSGQKPDTVIADIFILKSTSESAKMLAALRQKTESIQANVIEDAPQLAKGAFISHYSPEAQYGKRITFAQANLVITLSPSQNGMIVATKITEALRTP